MDKKITYSVSARGKRRHEPIADWILARYQVALDQVDSVFGFTEPCALYGGRPYQGEELSRNDIAWMRERGIGFRIPLTNHYVTAREYDRAKFFIERNHEEGNSLIIVNDALAEQAALDFPYYTIEASAIKNIHSQGMLDSALGIYETAVLPASVNRRKSFLEQIQNKDRVRLFANAGCAYTCPARICYESISRYNKGGGREPTICSQGMIPRDVENHWFDTDALAKAGFSRFKLLPLTTDPPG